MNLGKMGAAQSKAMLKAAAESPLQGILKGPEAAKLLAQLAGKPPQEVNALVRELAAKHPQQLSTLLGAAAAKNPKVAAALTQLQVPSDSLALSQIVDKITKPRPVATATGSGSVGKVVLQQPTKHNAVSFHLSPEESHRAVLDSIKQAKQSYYIETFIWHNDEAGNEVLSALAAKKHANPDFDIKVLVDGFGLRQGSGGSNDVAIVDKLRGIGADVLEYKPTWHSAELKEAVPYAYTHRKLYISDGSQFITGGRNIGNEYLKPSYVVKDKGVPEASWHDMLYTVQGDETGRVIDEFMKNWERMGGKVPTELPKVVPHATGKVHVQSVTTDPIAGTFALWDSHSKAIQNAKKEIVVRYPYFSDDQLVDELIRAKRAKPELDIKVILPANKEASHEGDIYAALNKATAEQFTKAGIEVRMFEGGKIDGQSVQRFSHMKAMSVDGELLSIGSANGDARTFNGNHELNTLIHDRKTAKVFRDRMITEDWALSKPVTPADLAPTSQDEATKRATLETLDFLL